MSYRLLSAGFFIAFLQILILGSAAVSQQEVGLTFFGDRSADITFERIGFAITTIGGRPGMMIVGDLAGIVTPETVRVTVLSHRKAAVCRRLVKVEFDSFSAWCPNLSVAGVAGIFVEEP